MMMGGLALVYGLVVAIANLPSFLLLGIFVPVMLSAEWAIESRRSFCVRLAVAGRHKFGDDDGVVEDRHSQQIDARTAVRISALAAFIGAAVTTLVYTLAVSL